MRVTSTETAWLFGCSLNTLTRIRNDHIATFPRGRLEWTTVFYNHERLRAWLVENDPERIALFDERISQIPEMRERAASLKAKNPGKKGGRPKKRGVEA
jgi:hypothetical protein